VEEGLEGSPATTLALLPEQDAEATDQPALPFQPAPPGAARPASMIARGPAAAEERAGSGTLALSLDDDWAPAAGAPGPSRASEDGALAASPAITPARAEAAETAVAPLPELEPAAPPPEPEPALLEPPPRPVLSASPARARSPEPDEPPPAPPPRRPPPPPPERPALPTPSPSLRRSLYERFDRKR
jgi:hypothetical protein